MTRTLKSILAKAFSAITDQSAANADSDYWWLLPQITPWPPPQTPPPVEPQSPETECAPIQELTSDPPFADRSDQRDPLTLLERGRHGSRAKKKDLAP